MKLALYSGNDPDGAPYIVDRRWDWTKIREASRYDLITLDVAMHHDPELIAYLRRTSIVLGLMRGPSAWGGPATIAKETWGPEGFWQDLLDRIPQEGYIRTPSGGWGVDGTGTSNLDLGHEATRNIFVETVLHYTRNFDGMFFDWWGRDPRWMVNQDDVPQVDWPAYFAGYDAASAAFAASGQICFSNGGKPPGFRGFVERFHRYGTWKGECDKAAGGWIESQALGEYPYRAEWDEKAVRFGLASALLFDAYYGITNTEWASLRGHTGDEWWFPEYDIELGEPCGPPVEITGRWFRQFEHGSVLVDPYRKEGTIEVNP